MPDIVPPPLSLYVHLPWCVRKCPYCDFNSHALRESSLPERNYIDALLRDLAHSAAAPDVAGRPLHSIFIGGGTPNLFSAAAISELLTATARHFAFTPDIEITLEANPGARHTTSHGDLHGGNAVPFSAYRAAGINRLSLGVQSLDDAMLRCLERIHSADDARHAIDEALACFPQVNLDFMFALPGQSPDDLHRRLKEAAGFGSTHLSFYQLTLEPHTRFHHAPPADLPDGDTAAAMQECVEAALSEAGYQRYEVSAYARRSATGSGDSNRCRHNLNYWLFGDYLGIGAGAHGKISSAGSVVRTIRQPHPQQYMAALQDLPNIEVDNPALLESRRVTPEELPFEFMLNALRLKEGAPRSLFAERTGLPLPTLDAPLCETIRRNLLRDDPDRFQTTDLGWRFLDDTVQCFLEIP